MIELAVVPAGRELRIGRPRGPVWRSAVLEGAGALLVWDAASDGGPIPTALVHDARRAAGWLWQMYGPEATAAVLDAAASGAERRFEATAGPLRAPARDAALASWRAAWWPASAIAGLPGLDPALVAAERIAALAELDGVLDDDEALERELRGIRAAALLDRLDAFAMGGVELASLARETAARLRAVVDDRGADAAEATAGAEPRADEHALAAGRSAPAAPAPLATGTSPIDLGRIAPGLVDAAAEARWTLRPAAGGVRVRVTAPAAPGAGAASGLRARYAGVGIELALAGAEWSGEAPVPARALIARDVRAEVFSPGYSGAEGPVDAPALLGLARARLRSPSSLSERAAHDGIR